MNHCYSHEASTSCQGNLEEKQAIPLLNGVWRETGAILPRRNGFTLSSLLLITSLANCSTVHSQSLWVVFFVASKKTGAARSVGRIALAGTGMAGGRRPLRATRRPSLHRKEGSGSTSRYFLFICLGSGSKRARLTFTFYRKNNPPLVLQSIRYLLQNVPIIPKTSFLPKWVMGTDYVCFA